MPKIPGLSAAVSAREENEAGEWDRVRRQGELVSVLHGEVRKGLKEKDSELD